MLQRHPTTLNFPTFSLKKNLKINLRNQIVAHILQPIGFININRQMRRDIFQAIADPTRRAIIVLLALQAMTPMPLQTTSIRYDKLCQNIYAF
jgi:hypothetical protein